jgi:hypothetical protein
VRADHPSVAIRIDDGAAAIRERGLMKVEQLEVIFVYAYFLLSSAPAAFSKANLSLGDCGLGITFVIWASFISRYSVGFARNPCARSEI